MESFYNITKNIGENSMSNMGYQRMKAILDLYSNEQILEEIKQMRQSKFNPSDLWMTKVLRIKNGMMV